MDINEDLIKKTIAQIASQRMNLPPEKTLELALDEAGFKLYTKSPSHRLFVRYDKNHAPKFNIDMMFDIGRKSTVLLSLTFKWLGGQCEVAIADGSEWVNTLPHGAPTGTLADVELAFKAIRDPQWIPALAGVEWARNLMEHLLKDKP